MSRVSPHFGRLGIGASLVLHAGVFAALVAVPRQPAPAPQSSVVEFEVPPVPEQKPPPEAPPQPEAPKPEPVIPSTPAQAKPEPAATSEAPPEEAPPAAVPVADLTGLTLTNDAGGASWSSRVGDGSAMARPIRAGRSGATSPAPAALASVAPARAPDLVPLADLSERPVPPKLDSVLEQHYPTIARQQGKSGTAIVRLRIDADGRVRKVNIVSESESGFGQACHSTVLGSRWSPPRDHQGNAVATFVSYTCRFRAEH